MNFLERRKKLMNLCAHKNIKNIIISSGLSPEHGAFTVDSNFYYLIGICEPGLFAHIAHDGSYTLWVSQFAPSRAQWVASRITTEQVHILGDIYPYHHVQNNFSKEHVKLFLEYLRPIASQGPIGVVGFQESVQRLFSLDAKIESVDVRAEVAQMRRIKDKNEIAALYQACAVTSDAYRGALSHIAPGRYEYEVQAALEYGFTSMGAGKAFDTIVAGGVRGTILHYLHNDQILKNNDLLVIDCGARYEGYCADISRTFPVSGVFTARQKEIYQAVLDTHEYIATQARPGVFLRNPDEPKNSLDGMAREFLKERGFADYFIHSIGHFLGLDVHDVGDYRVPLQEGDVITIEPGIYIPEERIGVRLEDDYWITKDHAVCLSDDIPKDIHGIQELIQELRIAVSKE